MYGRIIWLRRHEVSIDVDNIAKPILDALKGVVFEDDALISQCLVTRIDINAKPDFTIVDAGAPGQSYQELIDLLADIQVDDILYVEIGSTDLQRLVFGIIDGGAS